MIAVGAAVLAGDPRRALPRVRRRRRGVVQPDLDLDGRSASGRADAPRLRVVTNADPGRRTRGSTTRRATRLDYNYNGAGNWPFNAAYAAHVRARGGVTQLHSLAEAEQYIKAGIPLVASLSFGPGKLDGFLFKGTDGHLLVIPGFTASGTSSQRPRFAGDATVRHLRPCAVREGLDGGPAGSSTSSIPASAPLPPSTGGNW